MKGVNDDAQVIKTLFQKLLAMRVRPYYLYQADLTKGANHFRAPVSKGLEIMEALRGWTSGLAIPYFVIDAPGGGGKIPLLPNYVVAHDEDKWILRNFKYDVFVYPDVKEDAPKQEPARIVRKKRPRPKKVYEKKSTVKTESLEL